MLPPRKSSLAALMLLLTARHIRAPLTSGFAKVGWERWEPQRTGRAWCSLPNTSRQAPPPG